MTYTLRDGRYGKIYCLLQNNSFYYYDMETERWNIDDPLPSLPLPYTGVGSNLCYFGDPNYNGDWIFCTKGNWTNEFWLYDISLGQWKRLEDIPLPVYEGRGMAIATGDICEWGSPPQYHINIYLLKGVTSYNENSEFYVYHHPILPSPRGQNRSSHWEQLPHWDGTHGNGADLTYRVTDNELYAFAGKPSGTLGRHEFWKYSIGNQTWDRMADYIDPVHPERTGAFEGSALGTWGVAGNEIIPQPEAHDNIIYAFRGEHYDRNIFDAYKVPENEWDFDPNDVPRSQASRISHGSDLVCAHAGASQYCWLWAIPGEGYPSDPNRNLLRFNPAGDVPPEGGQALEFSSAEQTLVHISPNPSSGKIFFRLLSPISINSCIEIFNNSGKLIRRISPSISNREVIWDTKNDAVSSGVYFYTIKTESKRAFGKLIIQR